MKTKLFPGRYCLTAFWLLSMLFLGKVYAAPYQNEPCDHRNVFTLKAKITHNNAKCTVRNSNQPHAFIGIQGVLLHKDAVAFMKKLDDASLFNLYSATITNNQARIDLPLANTELNIIAGADYSDSNPDDVFLLLALNLKPSGNSGSSQTPLTEGFGNVSLAQTGISPIPIDGYMEIPPDKAILVKLTDILSFPLHATSECETIEISLETKCPFVLKNTKTVYAGYPYRISLEASTKCTENKFIATPDEYDAYYDFTYSDSTFRWRYNYADTNIHLPLLKKGTNIVVSPSDFKPEAMGKNIVVNIADGRGVNSQNSTVICFYPDLPQPLKNRFQRIPEGSNTLDVLRLSFNRSFDAGKEEKPTLLTVYSQVAQKADGSIKAGESKIVFQEAFDMAKMSGRNYTTSVAGKNIREGTYYVTVEGTVRNKSNRPDQNPELSQEIRNAIFQVVPVIVRTNDFEVEEVNFTPPACHGGNGKVKVTINAYFLPGFSRYPIFYYRTNPESSDDPIYDTIQFRCTYSGFTDDPHATFECDHITARHSHFKIVIPPMVASIGGGTTIGGGSTIIGGGTTLNSTESTKAAIGPNDTYNDRISFFSLDFSQPEPLQVPVQVKHLSGFYCINGTSTMADDGQISVFRSQASGGTPPYTFSYRDDYVHPSFTSLTSDRIPAYFAGYRYILMQDKNACRFDTTVFVSNTNTKLCAGIQTERAISCYNAGDGILSVTVESQNIQSLKYAWYKDNTLMVGKTGRMITDLGPGTYKVVVTETKTGMASSDEVTLTQPTQLKLSVQQQGNVDCFGEKSGMLALSGSGGMSPYLYLWNGVSYGSLRRNLAAGTYQVKLIDQNSCEISKTYTITQPEAAFEIAIDSVVHAHYGQNDEYLPGKILLHPQGGTKPYGTLVTDNADLMHLDAGTYRLKQHDAKSCTDEKEVTVEVYDKMRIRIVQDRHNLCFGESNAACHVVIEGGVPPFDISWSNGKKQSGITDMAAGIYSVLVKDAAGVIRTAEIDITQPEALSIESLLVKNPTYHGCTDTICPPNERDGEIRFSIAGGREPYLFSWTKDGEAYTLPSTQTAVKNLNAGNYLLTVRDSNGCTSRKEFPLREIAPLQVRIRLRQAISCHGDHSGILLAEASGGTPPYRYSWSNLSYEDSIAGGLPAGTYTVLVEDALGVTAQGHFTIDEPERLRILVQNIAPPSYPGSLNSVIPERKNNGELHVSAGGGTAPYYFSWIKNEVKMQTTDSLLTGLSDGNYHLQLRDKAGCMADTVFSFPFIEALQCSVSVEKPVSCFGMSDAHLTSFIQGGVPPYSIEWIENRFNGNHTVGRENRIENRRSGHYTLSVTDSNQVTASFEITLTQPDSLIVILEQVASLCHNDSSGSVTALAQGGTRPYLFQWNADGKISETADSVLSHLENANISLTITDKHRCSATASTRIASPAALRLTHIATPPSYQSSLWQECGEERNDGSIELSASGGTPPYRYVWANGKEGHRLENLDSGTYHVVLLDQNDCRLEKDIRLERTQTLRTELRLLNEPLCADSLTASFALSVQGGEKPYTFDWYKNDKWFGNDSSLTKTGMGAGTYKIFLRDANGLVSRDSLVVHEPERLSVQAEIKDATAWTIANGSIHLDLYGGTPPYRIIWNNGDEKTQINRLKRGIYRADIYDAHQCHTSVSYPLNSPDSLFISSIALQHCSPENPTGFIRLSVQGGMKPYRHCWKDNSGNPIAADSGNENLLALEGVAPGIYHFFLSDAGGAEIEQLFSIEEKRKLEAALLLEKPIRCHGDRTAVLQAWVRGGKEPYLCSWEGIPDSLDAFVRSNTDHTRLENLPAGTYIFKVRDTDLDTCSVSISITQAEALSLNAEIYSGIDSSGSYDGAIMLRAQGGRLPYLYLWNTGNTQPEQRFLRKERYHATVTDAEGCTASIDLDSVISRNIRIQLRQNEEIVCFGERSGALEVSVVNGKPPFDIKWSNGMSGQKIEGLDAGKYTVTVTDAYGRSDSGSYLIRQPERLQNLISIKEPSCYGFTDGHISLKTSGGNGYYSYAWNTGDYTPNLSQIAKGTYVVRVSDRRQCTLSDTITINEPEPLICHLLIDSILCPDENGRISWTATGGTLPYRHQWIRQENRSDHELSEQGMEPLIVPAAAGHYRLTVQDRNDCRIDTSISLVNPLPLSYTLLNKRSLCAGQELELQAEGCDTIDRLQYLWIYPDGTVSQKARITSRMPGIHQLTIIQNNRCLYRDSVDVIPFPDSIQAEFWVSSQITARQTCLLVNLSGYTPDSIAWHIPQSVKVLNRDGNYLEIQFSKAGLYTVGLTSYKGFCHESIFRQIEVFDEQQKATGDTERRRTRWFVAPNPTNSTCLLTGESDKPLSVRYRLVHAGTGKICEQGHFKLPQNGRISQTLFKGNEPAGMYILLLEYGYEKRSLKIVKL